jgi:flagellar secretion chaperone FliS
MEIIMNANAAISSYTKIQNQTRSDEDAGFNVVSTALNKLEKSLDLLQTSTNSLEREKAFQASLLTLYFLQKSLDFKSQGDLAINLFRLYEFCRIKVIENGVNESNDNHEIKKCHFFIKEILLAWELSRDK